MFAYSERPQTYAARKYADDVPEDVKKRRLTEIIQRQQAHALESNRRDVGTTQVVLVEGPSKRSAAQLMGRTDTNKVVVFDDTVDMADQARFAMEFCAEESCGKCTPCRIGSVRGVEVIDRIRSGVDPEDNTVLLMDLCEVMTDGSLCAMGGLTPMPVLSALDNFPEYFAPEARKA